MIALSTIAFNKPLLVQHQIRLLHKYLEDEHALTVFDNSSEEDAAARIMATCAKSSTPYVRVSTPDWLHNHALNIAAKHMLDGNAEYIGFLDHDLFPERPTRLIPLIDQAGFYCIGQRHSPTDSLYAWPGFFFMSRAWLYSKAPNRLNFDGIRGAIKADDGDCGSMNAPLFTDEDWSSLYTSPHGYRAIRRPDDVGVQSWAVEELGDWIHLSNGSGWLQIPQPDERERIVIAMLEAM